jgi:O-antigen/teichoic acid export membrane protein
VKTKSFIARVLSLSASRGIQDGLQALLLLWLARIDQSGYGLFVFGAGVAAMARTGLSLGLDQYTLREFSDKRQPRGPLLGRMIEIKAMLGAVILVCLVIFSLLKGWANTQTVVVMIIVSGQVMESIADTFFNLFRAEGRQVREGFYRSASNLAGAVYGAVCLFAGLGLVALAFFLVISNGLKLIAALVGVIEMGFAPARYKIGSFLPLGQIRSVLIIAGVSLLGSFYNYIQIFLLKQYYDLREVAYYGAASDLAGGISGLVAHLIIGAVLFPSLTATASKDDNALGESVKLYFWNLVIFGAGLAFFISTLGGPLLIILYGESYQSSITPLKILGPAIFLSFVNNLGVYVFLASRQERRLLIYHLLPAFLSIVLGIIVIPRYGSCGAAANLLVCRFAMLILVVGWLQHKYRPIRLPELRRFSTSLLSGGLIYVVLFRHLPYIAPLLGLLSYGLAMRIQGGLQGFPEKKGKKNHE